ncbi:MAG: cytidine deaminase [Verrucomicrobiota bacterium]|nr:cytidine deaminase [Verrucomicrobiota bacterium]MEC8330642.1 cytidine deaminase [Verrucomicrobiota bacterium]MEC9227312.1 cytidine deaminase [Verrucomicrobiota bacterium]
MPFNQKRLNTILNKMPAAMQELVSDTLGDASFNGYIKASKIIPLEDPKFLNALLEVAKQFSVAPISNFYVGAIAVGNSGNLYFGANIEFVGVPLSASIHAEQSAVMNAWIHGEKGIKALQVSELPCGHCRQFLLELSNAHTLPVTISNKRYVLTDLIPHHFGTAREAGQGLLDSPKQALKSVQSLHKDLSQRALNAAEHSYTPHTKNKQGFIIEDINGGIHEGRSAESAAFNPTVLAVTSALNQRNLSANREVAIKSCIGAQVTFASHSQSSMATAILRSITSATVEHIDLKFA